MKMYGLEISDEFCLTGKEKKLLCKKVNTLLKGSGIKVSNFWTGLSDDFIFVNSAIVGAHEYIEISESQEHAYYDFDEKPLSEMIVDFINKLDKPKRRIFDKGLRL